MTVEQMHRDVNLRLQKVNSNAFDDLLSEELDIYLNRAVSRFIKSRLEPLSNLFQKGFEQSQKRIDDLRELVVKDSSITTEQRVTDVGIDGYFADEVDFPADYLYLLSARFKIEYSRQGVTFILSAGHRAVDGVEGTDYNTKIVLGKYAQQDDVYRMLLDPYNKSKALEPIYDVSEGGIGAYTDDKFIVEEIILDYIKQPATILLDEGTPANNVDCDLSEHTHEEITDMAVKMILTDIDQLGPAQKVEDLTKVE